MYIYRGTNDISRHVDSKHGCSNEKHEHNKPNLPIPNRLSERVEKAKISYSTQICVTYFKTVVT